MKTQMLISILCPTRGRPDRFARFLKSVEDTTVGECEVWVGVDEDDPALGLYLVQENVTPPHSRRVALRYCVEPRMSFVKWINYLATQARGDVLFITSDDMESKTHGWDEGVYRDVPADGVFIASARAGGGEVHGVGRAWYEALGFLLPPMFEHYYSTTSMLDVSQMLNRHFACCGVWTEERHDMRVPGGFTDETCAYHAREGYKYVHEDNRIYREDCERMRPLWAEKLRARMK